MSAVAKDKLGFRNNTMVWFCLTTQHWQNVSSYFSHMCCMIKLVLFNKDILEVCLCKMGTSCPNVCQSVIFNGPTYQIHWFKHA